MTPRESDPACAFRVRVVVVRVVVVRVVVVGVVVVRVRVRCTRLSVLAEQALMFDELGVRLR